MSVAGARLLSLRGGDAGVERHPLEKAVEVAVLVQDGEGVLLRRRSSEQVREWDAMMRRSALRKRVHVSHRRPLNRRRDSDIAEPRP